ncbi:ASB_HP2_G0031800.mRNA.1.CDS.1 [Saccharomyces cerevisiae]|nr:ASB_HP2_G0031800.mRNA.1.CDS.1 [Saccharomyces cerevisiae]CAI6612649.1 ASB_HP2_G0031800.mRNA.1.CDS.1 [Saccharomyces cerevisiae]
MGYPGGRDLLSDTEKLCFGTHITRRRETISVLDSTRGKQGSQKLSACLEGRSKSCIIKYGATCVNRRQRCCSNFLNWDEKVPGRNGRQKTIRSLWKRSRKSWSFAAFAFHDERWTAGPQYVKLQFSRYHDVEEQI